MIPYLVVKIIFFTFLVQPFKKTTASGDGHYLLTIPQGRLRGFGEESLGGKRFFSFLGIPFAKPPVGNLRLKDPVPAEAWEGVLEANKEPECCLQVDMMAVMNNVEGQFMGKEDCLYLSVYSPKPGDIRTKLPVMVFIHGGGYASGGSKEYKPYVWLDEEIVLVVIQYRLSALGFLSAGEIELSGNYGLKDQTMALRWVKQNIQSFGGDPDRVTLFGQSAGGVAAHLHMLSPWSKGLFHRIIAQSGSALCNWDDRTNIKSNIKKIGSIVGCPFNVEEIENFVVCLQQLPPEVLLSSVSEMAVWGSIPTTMVPQIDGDFLPDDPVILLREQNYNKVNLMSGTNRDEGIMFVFLMFSDPKLFDSLLENFDHIAPYTLLMHDEENASQLATRIYNHFLKGKELNRNAIPELKEMFSERIFEICHDISLQFHSKDCDIDVYTYELNHQGKLTLGDFFNVPEGKNMIAHGDELFYMFYGGPTLVKTMNDPKDLLMRQLIIKLWTNFAATGNPTPDDSLDFKWLPTTSQNFNHLNLTLKSEMSSHNRNESMEFWMSLSLRQFDEIRNAAGDFHYTSTTKGEL